jgi:hypothetical protein
LHSDKEIIEALQKAGGSRTLAADLLGVRSRGFLQRLSRMRGRGIDVPGACAGNIHGTSTLHGPEGNVLLQWVKKDLSKRTPDDWADSVREVFATVDPIKCIPKPKSMGLKDLLTVIPVGDHHTGCYAWGEESGADYDIKIAEKLLAAGASHLIDISPPGQTCYIVSIGDFFHYDSHRAETPANHNALDADTRYAAMIRAGAWMMRTFIEKAAAKYPEVIVEIAAGNHDPIGSIWLATALTFAYEKNPRIKIRSNAAKYSYLQHGKVMLGVTHGDTAKLDKLGGIMATDNPEMWGDTLHRYWLTGHIHQRRVIELPGCMVESFRTLAARDAWSSAAGYRSGRDMTSLVFHREHGEVARHRFALTMLEAA